MLSAYSSGADAVLIDVRKTSDGHLVLSADEDLMRLAGVSAIVETSTLKELRALNLAATFKPKNSPDFFYFDPAVASRRLRIDTLDATIDQTPDDLELIIAPRTRSGGGNPAETEELIAAILKTLVVRDAHARAILCCETTLTATRLREMEPKARIVIVGLSATELVRRGVADGLIVSASEIFTDGEPSVAGAAIAEAVASSGAKIGAIIRPLQRTLSAGDRVQWSKFDWIWGATSDSLLDPGVRPEGIIHLQSDFRGAQIDTAAIALGYAKANKWARIHQSDGIHVEIAPYDGPLPVQTDDPIEARLQAIEDSLHFANRDWPYYSGGGLGTVVGISGSFSAEVEYRVQTVAQATTLEMAVTNVDPGAHQAKPPLTFRDKDSFYDPHGAPPYVGVEHDEDDGYRINWNFGSEYDSNQYGKPVGDGRLPRGAQLRLERRGAIFSAYYRNPVGADSEQLSPRDWVCVGVIRNESMNRTVFLRCAAKRWRQEREDDTTKFHEIVANKYTFMRLSILRY